MSKKDKPKTFTIPVWELDDKQVIIHEDTDKADLLKVCRDMWETIESLEGKIRFLSDLRRKPF